MFFDANQGQTHLFWNKETVGDVCVVEVEVEVGSMRHAGDAVSSSGTCT